MLFKVCFNVGVSQCKPHMPTSFDGMAGFEVVASHVFPQVLLVAITLVGDQTRDGGASPEAECEASLSLDQWTYWPYQGSDPIPRC